MRETVREQFLDIHCPQCGAPAHFDILRQAYTCAYCGGKVGISEAAAEKRGWRKLRQRALKDNAKKYDLEKAVCSGCGAAVVFEKNEALSNCAFCGRSLVRKTYVNDKELPEAVIPFSVTPEQARENLEAWCEKNRRKREAKHLLPLLGRMKGCYLPYEMLRGPVHIKAGRQDSYGSFDCEGEMENTFVNGSSKLDNLLLDAMEPYDPEELREFDFGYVAGHCVKIPDVQEKQLEWRIREEAASAYRPELKKIFGTEKLYISAEPAEAARMPVLLPVYYVQDGETMAAVNGQTGKVSVRSEKVRHYFFLPRWLKYLFTLILLTGVCFGALRLFGWETNESLYLTGILAFFFAIIFAVVYRDAVETGFSVVAERKVFTSGTENEKQRRVVPPVFFREVEGKTRPVSLVFRSAWRTARMFLLSAVVMFFPVLCALVINGFDFGRLKLGGSAVWFCVAVPCVPVYLIKFGFVELYERPWIYEYTPEGKKKRLKSGKKITLGEVFKGVLWVMTMFVAPPGCLAAWFGAVSFVVMVGLTAGYWW